MLLLKDIVKPGDIWGLDRNWSVTWNYLSGRSSVLKKQLKNNIRNLQLNGILEHLVKPPPSSCWVLHEEPGNHHGRHLTHEEKSPTSLSLHGSLFTKTLPCWKCVLRTICSHGRSAQSCHCLYSDKYSWVLSKAQKICSKAQHPWLHSLPYKTVVFVVHCFFFF